MKTVNDENIELEKNDYINENDNIIIYGKTKSYITYLSESIFSILLLTLFFPLLHMIYIIFRALLVAYTPKEGLGSFLIINETVFIIWFIYIVVFGSIATYNSNDYSVLYLINQDYIAKVVPETEFNETSYSIDSYFDKEDLVDICYTSETETVEFRTTNDSIHVELPSEKDLVDVQNKIYNI